MQRSEDRILTTHVGSMVRPQAVLDIMRDRPPATPFDETEQATIRDTVAELVQRQAEVGIDVVNDGEMSKSSFSGYVSDRLTGFEVVPGPGRMARSRDRARFRDFYNELERPATSAYVGDDSHIACTGPITYRGDEALKADIANLRAALDALDGPGVPAEAFIPAVGPGTVEMQRDNVYYASDEEYVFAIAEALRSEYRKITEEGFILQIDDPRLATEFDGTSPEPSPEDYQAFIRVRIDALNHALTGIDPARVRFHLCWGSWHGPHSTDVPLEVIIGEILRVNAGAISLEAANPQHEHEYHVWERVKFPEGKVIIPGVIAHTTNHIEHPELIAERIGRYADLVGRENVIASADCGFAQGAQLVRAHPDIMWAKLEALVAGARLASERLW